MVQLDTTRRQALPGLRHSAKPLPGAVPGPPPHAPLPLPLPLPPTSDLDFAAALEIFDSEGAEQLAWIDTEDRLAQQLVERLVSLGATVNFKQLLSRACAAGHICLVRRLLSCELQLLLPPPGRAPQPPESMLSRQQRACKDLRWTFLVACYVDTIKQARHAGRCMKLLQLLRKLYREQEAGDGGGGGPAAYAGADVPDRLCNLERQSLAANTNPRVVLGLVTWMAHPWASGAAFRTSGGAAGAAGATAGATAAGPSTSASSSGTAAMLLPTAATVADRLAPWSVCSREHGTSAATAADVTSATVPEPLPSRRKRQMLQREQASQQR
ncbi:hypothetical protein CHLRE_11g467661v5 [Chlamydomonas reinhardtii]|uniref:Uncharacterized protein n=1 Tax=Chlamydomonas reinhardtii TaxID=3055 RepID=A0A2K3D7L4_CHLRE|nr:uncharacterized protein CHLRE_11g467661v5 [Chlamydomonas reinhardtii]PNW76520.1 hypothetical protein CHLRE_11g467661v5 [Chlamydomonas reinhardtii]